MSKTQKNLLAGALLLLLVVALALTWLHFAPRGSAGDKSIALDVTHGDGTMVHFRIATDAQFLRQALEDMDLISGSEGPYGMYVTTVDGETADESARQWWCFTREGEMLSTGVDETPIADGESYEATLSTY